MKRHTWLWVTLFILGIIAAISLAASWNTVLIRHYTERLELIQGIRGLQLEPPPWLGITAGSLGFVTLTALLVAFFIKALKEMRLNQLQSEFLAQVTHELKSPLAALELTASMLQSPSTDDSKRLWSLHQRELRRLRQQVDQLLEASAWEFTPVKPKRQILVLETWIQTQWTFWADLLGNGATFTREGEPLPYAVELDPTLMSLIFSNLLENARKYSRHNTPQVSLVTSLVADKKRHSRRWRIELRDQGQGWEQGQEKKIFKRFHRAAQGDRLHIAGSGLGLWLVKTAAQAQAFTVHASSPGIGKGATFTLEGDCFSDV